MRRLLLVPVLAAALVVSACSSSSGTQRTTTVIATITSSPVSASVSGSATATGSGLTVVGSTQSSASGSVSASVTPKSTAPVSPTTASAAPIVKVDPLQSSCPSLLSSADIKKAIGATVGTNNNRVRLGAAAHGVTKAARCLFGSTDGGKTAPVRIRITQYDTAANAKKQVEVDVQDAQDKGATITPAPVNGYPATLQLMAGAVIEMQYDNWTLSVAVSDKLASTAALTTGMPVLAGQVLTRVIKNG